MPFANRTRLPRALALGFGAIALTATLLWLAGSLVAAPRGRPMPSPAAPGRVVRFPAADGVMVEANYWPGARADAPAVLLLHGIDGSRAMFDAHAAWLHDLGYAVLAPDFRGHGGSSARERTFGWREAAEAEAALAFVTAAGARRVAAIGVSMGGAAALLGRGGPLGVDALVLQAVYPTLRAAIGSRITRYGGLTASAFVEPLLSAQSWPRYGVSPARIAPIEGLRRYAGPVLVIGGTDDWHTPEAETRALHATAPGDAALWIVDGANHEAVCGLWTAEYRERIARFLETGIGKPV